jgi:hypothetical protein
MPGVSPRLSRFPLLAASLQLVAWLIIWALYTRIYTSYDTFLAALEIPLTDTLLAISGFGGGGLALIGIYKLLAYAHRGIALVLLLMLAGLSLLWAGVCVYALLIFLPVI